MPTPFILPFYPCKVPCFFICLYGFIYSLNLSHISENLSNSSFLSLPFFLSPITLLSYIVLHFSPHSSSLCDQILWTCHFTLVTHLLYLVHIHLAPMHSWSYLFSFCYKHFKCIIPTTFISIFMFPLIYILQIGNKHALIHSHFCFLHSLQKSICCFFLISFLKIIKLLN